MQITRAQLFGKLNSMGYKALEAATVLCKMRGNPSVELVHWLHQILQLQDSDVHRIIKRLDLDPAQLAADLNQALDGLPRGRRPVADVSTQVDEVTERGWVFATLMFGESQVRTGHLLIGLLSIRSLREALIRISRQFERVDYGVLTDTFDEITTGSPELGLVAFDGTSISDDTKPGVQRRLDDPLDLVRIEIESALKRDIPVIPVLVGGATMPSEAELPKDIKPLAYRNGTQVRRDPDFHNDMRRLITSMSGQFQDDGSASTVFVSYRRDDSADVTGRIYDSLVAQFGVESVYKDVDTIPLGVDYRDYLADLVGSCSALLAVIGTSWLHVR